MFDTVRAGWLRVGRWPRLIAAAACLLLAALTALGSARTHAAARTPHTAAVVVATHPVGAGRILRAGDLRVEHWPVTLHPPRTPADPRSLVGRRTAGALTAREPLTAARVLGSGVATGLPAGTGAVPIEIDGGRVPDYVRVGDHVDVLAGPPVDATGGASSTAARLVAGDVAVLGVLPGGTGEATVVVIAADRATALRVTRGSGSFTLVVIPP